MLGLRLPRPQGRLTPRRGWSLLESLVVVGVGLLATVLYVPTWLHSQREQTWLSACQGFHAIRMAEDALFYFDLDANGAQDYWCRDIRGLAQFRTKSAALIDERLAASDGATAHPRPWFDHLFRMVEVDSSGRPFADSDGFGKRYDCCMYPAQERGSQYTAYSRDRRLWGYPGRKPLRREVSQPESEGWRRFHHRNEIWLKGPPLIGS